jgi:peptidyl-prolyl cis-trans isomerase B (cyclophilin B)
MKRLFACFLFLSLLLTSASCSRAGTPFDGVFESYTMTESATPTDYVLITMENGDRILIQLYPDVAPITVQNFKELVGRRFYDGIRFHRVIKGFMIQGGDPTGTGYNGSGKTIKGEFALNGVKNDLSHTRGVISMARTSKDMNSASSQFFIVQSDNHRASLDGSYAAFGRVLAGMDTVDKIASVPTNSKDRPLTDQVMKTVRFVNVTFSE